VREGKPLVARTAANQEWALDFAPDAAACGRAIRMLSVVDAYTRECLALEVDTSFASRRVTRVLEAIVAGRGVPQAIRCDNGPDSDDVPCPSRSPIPAQTREGADGICRILT